MSDLPSVACILLNWNGWQDTIVCLEHLSAVDYPRLSVMVVDNGSTDGSVEHIRSARPGIELIESGRNLGFSAGNNLGIRAALQRKVDYVWLLNNDAQPRPDALAALVAKAEADARLGEVGSVLLYADNPETVQAWGGGKVNVWTGRILHATQPQADSWFDYLTAASVLLRRSALEEIGLLDEGFFLYFEDADLSYRLRGAGWKLGVARDSIVLHKEHASTGRNQRVLHRYNIASGIRFMLKHSPAPWLSVPLQLSLKVGKRLLTGQLILVGDVLGGVRDYLKRRRESTVKT